MKEDAAREREAQRGLARPAAQRGHGAAWPLRRTPPRPRSPVNSTRSTQRRRWRPPNCNVVQAIKLVRVLQRRDAKKCALSSCATAAMTSSCALLRRRPNDLFEPKVEAAANSDASDRSELTWCRRDGPRPLLILSERSKPKGRDGRSPARGEARERDPAKPGDPMPRTRGARI